MKLRDLFFKKDIKTGLSTRSATGQKFNLTRFVNKVGTLVYSLENTSRTQRIYIEHHLFDRFRASLKEVLSIEKEDEIDKKIFFGDDCYFRVKNDNRRQNWICIHDLKPSEDSTSIFELSISGLKNLVDLLYDEKVKHTSGVLDRIISYLILLDQSHS